jgi:hypothetical protein
MTVCDILIYPLHKAELRRKSDSVAGLNRRVRQLILDLKDTFEKKIGDIPSSRWELAFWSVLSSLFRKAKRAKS